MILVAGGNGYLGQPFCQSLTQNGESVISLDIAAQDNLYPDLTVDVRDYQALEKVFDQHPIRTVVDLAALLVSASAADPLLSFQVNVLGAFNLLRICHEFTVPRFVFGSSFSVLGNLGHVAGEVDEDVTPQPTNFYGQTKDFVERMGMTFSELSGVQFISARMPILVGPGEPTATTPWRAEIFNLIHCGGEVIIDYAPDEVLPLAHYEDVANALRFLTLSEDAEHKIYHLPYENWTVEELGQTLMEINPSFQVTYGERRLQGSPLQISWSRIREEFGVPQPSLHKRLVEQYKYAIKRS
ncbi:MAG: NAD(P)-dependent oxidoreductase [Anaerolineales bacterium]